MVSLFLYPLIPSSIPTSHHFSTLFIHLLHCGKCGKICGKLATFAYKCSISQRKILINTPKSCQNTLLDILFLVLFNLLYPLYIGNPFSPRPLALLGSPSSRSSFFEPNGSQKNSRLRRVVILEKVLGKRGNYVFVIVNIVLIIDGMD